MDSCQHDCWYRDRFELPRVCPKSCRLEQNFPKTYQDNHSPDPFCNACSRDSRPFKFEASGSDGGGNPYFILNLLQHWHSFIGIVAINITKAGAGIVLPEGFNQELPEAKAQGWQDVVLHVFPENFIKSIYHGDVLPIVIFSVIFGISLALLSEQKKKPILDFTESLAETMFKFTNIIMHFAPFGVGAAIAVTVGHLGIDILTSLLKLLFTLYGALLVFLFGCIVTGSPIGRRTDPEIFSRYFWTCIHCFCDNEF